MRPLNFFQIVLLAGAILTASANAQNQNTRQDTMKPTPVVVFVCEHGSAKSVVAAAHFNKLASGRNLKLRATACGTHPDSAIAPKAVKGLQADSVAFEPKPRKLVREDIAGALRVVAFCELPEDYAELAPIEQWNNVPPISEDYDKARDAMVAKIKRLLEELQTTSAF